jgi:IclR family transcriptional regulator, acetate operon repressor
VEQEFHIVSTATQPNGTQAIDRAAQLLVRVVESTRPIGVGELAETAGLPKSTTSRLVSALERHALVQRVGERGGLRPGPVLLRFAQRGVPDANLVELAEEPLRWLADASGETINLAVPTAGGVEHLAQRDSRHFVGVTSWVGRRVPLHCAANGKVFLAFGAAPIPGRLEPLTPRTITDRSALEAELEDARARGYATATDELELGLSALAAPVQAADGRVVAALSISAPTARLAGERAAQLAPVLLEQARALSRRLGHQPNLERGAA